MPIMQEPEEKKYMELPSRQALLAAKTSVLVVGGGPAGLGAAAGSAATGADTVLVERHGFLGGNATAALVMPLMSFFTQHYDHRKRGNHSTFLPSDHGQGDPVIAGMLSELLKRLINNGGAIPPSDKTGYVVPFDPEIFKITAMEMMDDMKVKMLFHSFASGMLKSGKNPAVVFETKSGPLVIEADVIIDCTGDGDIAASAGAEFITGREEDGLMQPMTLMFRIAEFKGKLSANTLKHIRSNGKLSMDYGILSKPHPSRVNWICSVRIFCFSIQPMKRN
jgi:hypothetical protein